MLSKKNEFHFKKIPSISSLIKCDDNEQYSRRNCLRIHGIESKKNEKIDDVWQKVTDCYEPVQVSFAQEDIDCAHRIGL